MSLFCCRDATERGASQQSWAARKAKRRAIAPSSQETNNSYAHPRTGLAHTLETKPKNNEQVQKQSLYGEFVCPQFGQRLHRPGAEDRGRPQPQVSFHCMYFTTVMHLGILKMAWFDVAESDWFIANVIVDAHLLAIRVSTFYFVIG